MTSDAILPRRVALELLVDVLDQHRLLSEVLAKRLDPLPPDGRARAQRLALTALRCMDRSDRMLGQHLKKKPPLPVMALLRLAVAEICEEGQAAHGVVNASVAIARSNKATEGFAGLVNAVLRKVAGETAKWQSLPVPRLPKWLRGPLISDYGKATVEAMEAAHYAGAPLDLTPKGDASTLAQTLGGTVLPTGSVRLAAFGQVSGLPGFDDGTWWVQDAAAAVPARVLAAQPGERVLDLCAAPGGKTLQLAAAGAEVTALDISAARMTRLEENLARCQLEAETVVADALNWAPAQHFDAILLDAPCSATGTIRRHPDLPYAKDGSEFPGLFELQEHLIDRALGWLKPGGRLVYCTCSLLIDEGEEQMRDALGRHPGLELDRDALTLPGIESAWLGAEGGLRLRPDHWSVLGGMDGFYIAALRKPA
jgi:16S rRNA (cytosine967-C5)-methyltransferase